MLSILITFLTFVLILVSLFMVLVILMQRANANAGMGSAFGGGAAESAFGAETSNILTKATRYCAFAFFGLSLILYILYLRQTHVAGEEADLLQIETTTRQGTQPAAGFSPDETTADPAAGTATDPNGDR